jgi:hypothetical protein
LSDLSEMREAHDAARLLARVPKARHNERHEKRHDRDDDKKFEERKPPAPPRPADMAQQTRLPVHALHYSGFFDRINRES